MTKLLRLPVHSLHKVPISNLMCASAVQAVLRVEEPTSFPSQQTTSISLSQLWWLSSRM